MESNAIASYNKDLAFIAKWKLNGLKQMVSLRDNVKEFIVNVWDI